jgi:hypothetical protein
MRDAINDVLNATLKSLERHFDAIGEVLRSIYDTLAECLDQYVLTLSTAEAPPTSIFGFSEYLASLALLLLVMASSDFRFRFRLVCAREDLRAVGSWLAVSIGFSLLAIDVWFQNKLPIPKLLSNANNLKAFLALVFLFFVFRVLSIAFLRPPVFGNKTARSIFNAAHQFILEGDSERVRVVAEELRRSIPKIINFASDANVTKKVVNDEPEIGRFAHDILLLMGDVRFCRVVVDKAPLFAINLLQDIQSNPRASAPIFQFVRNVGEEFITNKNSAFYQEIAGYRSGYLGYSRPITNIVFGSYQFVERCANENFSPLDVGYSEICDFDGTQMNGYARAALAFVESYIKQGTQVHSYALNRVFQNFEFSLGKLYRLNGNASPYNMPEFERLNESMFFVRETIDLLERHTLPHVRLRKRKRETDIKDIYDLLAALIFDAVFHSASVESPAGAAWSVQYGEIWSRVFTLHEDRTTRIVAFKLRRLVFDEIREMDRYANFKSAGILGYMLNVFGPVVPEKGKARTGWRYFIGLHRLTVDWFKKHYLELRKSDPAVAKACLFGSISFEEESHTIVKTYAGSLGIKPVWPEPVKPAH